MKKVICFGSMLFVGLCAGLVYAKAIKVTRLIPVGSESSSADGMVIINGTNAPSIEVQLAVTDFQAMEPYFGEVQTFSTGGTTPRFFQTNPAGNGGFHATINGQQLVENDCVCVCIWHDDGDGIFEGGSVDLLSAHGGANCSAGVCEGFCSE